MRPASGWLWTTGLVALRTASAVPTVEIKGAKFFTSEGNQFYIKGVVYQAGMNNLNQLIDGKQCEIDAKLIGELGANVIRVYSVDPTMDHSVCMNAFADEGIYIMVDMATPLLSINRNDPKWTVELRNQFVKVIDGFQKYDNFLGMFAGNEVLNDGQTTDAAPVVKAIIADMKAYRDLMQYRKVPIGYAATDNLELDLLQQNYFDCGNETVAADFFGMNKFSWCGDSSMEESGYDALYKNAEGYDIPIFLSETGCQTSQRDFEDQIAILGRNMNDRFSGNIVYQWAEGVNKYGLVSYSNDAATGTPSLMEDYTRLKSQWATLSPAGVQASTYDPTLTRRECPEFTSSTWLVRADAALPTLGISGFTAPTGPRSTSSGSRRATGGVPAATTGLVGGLSPSDSADISSSKPPTGAIVGGVVSGVILLGIITGVFFFLRRKKRKGEIGSGGGSEARSAESDKMVVTPEDPNYSQNGYYGPKYHELSEPGTTQGLYSKPAFAAVNVHELKPDSRNAELPDQESVDLAPHQATNGVCEARVEDTIRTNVTVSEPSTHVQAQRRREMEWLESEEARLRQRREQLMQQGTET